MFNFSTSSKLLYILLFISSVSIFGQKENYINIVVPEEDSTTTTLSRYRLGANTLPGSSVELNGKKLKVYPSGAFVDLMRLDFGENKFKIKSTYRSKSVKKEFVIIREDKSLETTDEDVLVIEDDLMQPNKDMWLDYGDVLEVQVKGTPEAKVTFMNGIEMFELPTNETKGIKGIYNGIYRVKENDNIVDEPIKFIMEKDGEIVEKESEAKITINPNRLPRVGVTNQERAYLNYGLGGDRLGGAKLSFIPKGIKLIIDGMIGDQYRVKLTDNFVAWIPTNQVDLLPFGTHIPKSLTESWAVYGGKKSDKIIIRLNEKLPFSTRQEINPTRIIVDLYGATSNSNWITQHLTTEGIKNVSYEQVEEDLFRVIIEPTHKQVWGYKVDYKNTALQISVKKQPDILDFKHLSFVLDAGHGGDNRGSLGASGLLEKDVTLDIVKRLEKKLKARGSKVYTTRDSDVYSKNTDRLEKLFSNDADVLISIHANSIGYSSNPKNVKGTSTFYKHLAFRPLSVAIYKRMLELDLEPFGNVGSFNFTLNSPTELVNVLVETAFMSNPTDEMKLMDADFKDKIVDKIIQGVQDWLYECDGALN